jgi:ribosomal-protein-alanine N-acetyltransferase
MAGSVDQVAQVETQRLRMRPVEPQDLEDFFELYSDSRVMRFMGAPANDRADTQAPLDRMLDHWQSHGFGIFVMLQKPQNTFVGRCGIKPLPDESDIELLYTLKFDYWGQGLATEAARATLGWALGHTELQRIVTAVDPSNVRSVNVLQKCGLQHEGAYDYNGTPAELYAIYRHQYLNQ